MYLDMYLDMKNINGRLLILYRDENKDKGQDKGQSVL